MDHPHRTDGASILQLLQEEMLLRFPAFPEAFGQLNLQCCPELKGCLATDGQQLFFQPELLCRSFLTDSEKLRRCYLHLHVHCLCLHIIQSSTGDAHLWDLACDLSASLLCEQLLKSGAKSVPSIDVSGETEASVKKLLNLQLSEKTSEDPFRELIGEALHQFKDHGWLTARMLLPLLEQLPALRDLAAACALDSHDFWFRDLAPHTETGGSCSGTDPVSSGAASHPSSLPRDTLEKLEALEKRWHQKLPRLITAARHGQRNGAPGTLREEADLQQQDSMDYHQFLRRFSVPKEEALIDMDAFDYIPYYYGLVCYPEEIRSFSDGFLPPGRGIPFIEPLEYQEVNRLDELAIAIDTSGSCSGKIVRRFLEETWSILRQRENFFARMRLHVIQCDCMIQEHRIFTSVEEWEDSLQNLQILGHGNTDFCPVFSYLQKQIEKKEIRSLRGLLYFTDGDGIFPSSPPSWDTAFVFLNQQTEKHAIPDWAIRLNLHLPDIFTK